MKSVVGVTGTRRLVADGDSDGHADRFWAGALAASAAREAPASYEYTALPSARSRFAGVIDDDDEPENRRRGIW
ncbi:hypothetical protein [Paracoccus sphaerophysae]|uniref:Uncharacterized protein n=1 Tax=Paracoccus sphaerophysae TaxID=690417 RepID=A0A099EXT3_9RHOB|nr:hypothetical protein [Paracoccus sphaerophysae]KGJ03250.1 hypothetical protein IC63_13540 [Paracoccus sphaerophysae]